MRARFVKELERRITNSFCSKVQALLQANPYTGTIEVITWVASLFKANVSETSSIIHFEQAVTAHVHKLLAAGDDFYFQLLLTSQFISAYTSEEDSKTPYTDAIRSIYYNLCVEGIEIQRNNSGML